ncbi:ATP-binding protein [Fibrella arboris]|uniref:ATP-binding protein n=1 Tax=Fibrella arboris TaxID=3242486 RepID=UPI0035229F5C
MSKPEGAMFERVELAQLKQRVVEPRRSIQVVMGPRQVGKTTLVRQLIGQLTMPCHFVAADGVAGGDGAWVAQQWETARFLLKSQASADVLLIIDEVQKIDNWAEIVKAEWDKDTFSGQSIKLILLGSARLLLQKGLSESLAGRFELIQLTHWSFDEMEAAFGFSADEFVWFGGYPGAASLISDEKRWQDYILNSLVETTLSKDILMLTRVDKPALLRRLFELGASYSGQIVSLTKLQGQLQDAGNTTTLSHYLTLLDGAGLLSGLDKYAPDKARQRASIPKWQVQNNAFSSALSLTDYEESRLQPELWGRYVETAIGTHLARAARLGDLNLYYWREGNDEVDFVIERKGKVIGLEVKSGRTQSARGMDAFLRKVGADKVLLVGNSGIPWQEFLKIDCKNLF